MRPLGQVTGLIVLALASAGCFRTSDSEMIAVFKKHRQVLEEIARMCIADQARLKGGGRYVRVPDNCRAWKEGDVADARCLGDYRPLKNKAGLAGDISCGEEAVYIGYRGNMMAMGGWLKGFALRPEIEASVQGAVAVAVVDEINDGVIDKLYRQHDHLEIYRDIGEGWFINYSGDS
jgi:hypothetical protein